MLFVTRVFFCVTILHFVVTAYVPKVNTPNGVVVGYQRRSYNGRTFIAFEGIPYAKKPIGQLRFEVFYEIFVKFIIKVEKYFRSHNQLNLGKECFTQIRLICACSLIRIL